MVVDTKNSIRPRIKIHGGPAYIRFGIQYIEFLERPAERQLAEHNDVV
jgi:hypothetical protein